MQLSARSGCALSGPGLQHRNRRVVPNAAKSQRSDGQASCSGRVSTSNQHQSSSVNEQAQSRRQLLQLLGSVSIAPALLESLQPGAAFAEAEAVMSPAVVVPAPLERAPELMRETDYEFLAPGGYKFMEVPQEVRRFEGRGPAPERNPVRVRFDSPDGRTIITVIMRNAQGLKQTFTQVSDISVYGDVMDVAKLLVPRGSTLLSSGKAVELKEPREVPLLGLVEIPPKNYYRLEFLTPQNVRVYMSVAAMKGRLYVCSATTPSDRWEVEKGLVLPAVQSFRVRETMEEANMRT